MLAVAALALTACAGPAFVPYPEAEVAGVKSPHAFRGKPLCQGCHQPGRRELRADPVALCKGCHPLHRGNHPVEVVQAQPVAGLPLSPGRKVACHSCHDPHGGAKQPHLLRLEANALCAACHQSLAGNAHHKAR
ncbi:hypothetical protein AMPC_05150 [Anaeromyxobacter paludicola]|uniref:Doubled CXXCH motif domain-containing protein n=2 Tax=Anaeromyxobacter paludicola TaxID=2918171 RepID=A0ABM7X6D7_9BACT|nr:hypothetical protein AMPC_05150 [Anaeromyxobacter paludicola]